MQVNYFTDKFSAKIIELSFDPETIETIISKWWEYDYH